MVITVIVIIIIIIIIIVTMAILIINIRILTVVTYIFVIFHSSLVSYNIYRFSLSMVCRSAITCQWRCDRTTEYHQIKIRV